MLRGIGANFLLLHECVIHAFALTLNVITPSKKIASLSVWIHLKWDLKCLLLDIWTMTFSLEHFSDYGSPSWEHYLMNFKLLNPWSWPQVCLRNFSPHTPTRFLLERSKVMSLAKAFGIQVKIQVKKSKIKQQVGEKDKHKQKGMLIAVTIFHLYLDVQYVAYNIMQQYVKFFIKTFWLENVCSFLYNKQQSKYSNIIWFMKC